MLTSFNKLNIFFKTALLSFILGVVLSLALMFLFFIGWSEIILGLIIGIIFGIIIYVINGIIDNRQIEQKSYRLSIVFIFVRLALLVGFMLGMGFLYYRANVHSFNVIAIAGGYFLVELTFIILQDRKSVV